MIQRPQSVYLGLTIIAISLMLVFPIYTVTAVHELGSNEFMFGAYGLEGAKEGLGAMPMYLLYITLILISSAALFSFKKRPRQLLICRLALILHFLSALGLVLFYYLGGSIALSAIDQMNLLDANISVSMGLGLYMIIISVPLLIIAIRGIKRDEKLVKSLDRLR